MVVLDAQGFPRLIAAIGRKPDDVRHALGREMEAVAIKLAADIKTEKLSGQVLNVRTGRLRRSINGKVVAEGDKVFAVVGTNVFYGLIHEFGGKGWRAAMEAAKDAFAGSLPRRSFLRRQIREDAPDIRRRLLEAAVSGATKGSNPTASSGQAPRPASWPIVGGR